MQAGKALPLFPKHRNMCLQCGAFQNSIPSDGGEFITAQGE